MTKKRNKIQLTKARQAHVDRHKPQVIRGKPLNYSAALEQKYKARLDSMILQMTRQTRRSIEKLFKGETARTYFEATDESIASQARIITSDLQKRFDQLFHRRSRGLAESMVNGADKQSTSALHESLKELSGGLSIKTSMITTPMKDILKASINENVSLIRSIPKQYFTQIEGAVMRSITTGNGLQDLIPFFEKQETVTLNRAQLLARDQTRKAYSNLNAGRMKAIGVRKYEWVHRAGVREPRPLHVEYNGQIFSLDDPPVIQYATKSLPEVRGKPGDLINCHCVMSPIIQFEEISDDEQVPSD